MEESSFLYKIELRKDYYIEKKSKFSEFKDFKTEIFKNMGIHPILSDAFSLFYKKNIEDKKEAKLDTNASVQNMKSVNNPIIVRRLKSDYLQIMIPFFRTMKLKRYINLLILAKNYWMEKRLKRLSILSENLYRKSCSLDINSQGRESIEKILQSINANDIYNQITESKRKIEEENKKIQEKMNQPLEEDQENFFKNEKFNLFSNESNIEGKQCDNCLNSIKDVLYKCGTCFLSEKEYNLCSSCKKNLMKQYKENENPIHFHINFIKINDTNAFTQEISSLVYIKVLDNSKLELEIPQGTQKPEEPIEINFETNCTDPIVLVYQNGDEEIGKDFFNLGKKKTSRYLINFYNLSLEKREYSSVYQFQRTNKKTKQKIPFGDPVTIKIKVY